MGSVAGVEVGVRWVRGGGGGSSKSLSRLTLFFIRRNVNLFNSSATCDCDVSCRVVDVVTGSDGSILIDVLRRCVVTSPDTALDAGSDGVAAMTSELDDCDAAMRTASLSRLRSDDVGDRLL